MYELIYTITEGSKWRVYSTIVAYTGGMEGSMMTMVHQSTISFDLWIRTDIYKVLYLGIQIVGIRYSFSSKGTVAVLYGLCVR